MLSEKTVKILLAAADVLQALPPFFHAQAALAFFLLPDMAADQNNSRDQ